MIDGEQQINGSNIEDECLWEVLSVKEEEEEVVEVEEEKEETRKGQS